MNLKTKIVSAAKILSKRHLELSLKIYNRVCGERVSLYDIKKTLLIPKNKYILSPREDIGLDLIQDFINNKDTYDCIWSDNAFVDSYEADKEELYDFVLSSILGDSDASGIKRIIDVGCGTGRLLMKLKERLPNAEIAGTDYSDSSIDRCKERMPQGSFFVSDIHSLGESPVRYDVVLCMEVLEHIQHVDRAICCLRSLLASNGKLLITIPDGMCDTWTGHINFWEQIEFEDLLSMNNLQVLNSTRLSDGYTGGYLVYMCTISAYNK